MGAPALRGNVWSNPLATRASSPWHAARAFLLIFLVGCTSQDAVSRGSRPVSCHPVSSLLPLPLEIPESSGLVFGVKHPQLLWTMNDSGGAPEVFALDRNGRLVGRVRVAGARNVDWEDMAHGVCPAVAPDGAPDSVGGEGDEGRSCLYLADVGDNLEVRNILTIYRVPEPNPWDLNTELATAFPIRFPHGPRDVEAIFLLPGEQLYLVTKGRNHPVEVYRYPGSLRAVELVTLEWVQNLTEGAPRGPGLVTGGSATPAGDVVALRSYASLFLYRVAHDFQPSDRVRFRTAAPGMGALPMDRVDPLDSRPLLEVNLLPLREPQGEAVAFGPGDTIAVSSERGPGAVQAGSLLFLSCPGL